MANETMPIIASRPFFSSASCSSLNFSGSCVHAGTPKLPANLFEGYLFSQYTCVCRRSGVSGRLGRQVRVPEECSGASS